MDNKRVRCDKCNSTQTYYRIKTKEIVCSSCGNIVKNGVEKPKEVKK